MSVAAITNHAYHRCRWFVLECAVNARRRPHKAHRRNDAEAAAGHAPGPTYSYLAVAACVVQSQWAAVNHPLHMAVIAAFC